MKVLLWDIDGTLVDTQGLGGRAMNLAFRKVYGEGLPELPWRSMAGKTDLQILAEFLEANAIPHRDIHRERRRVFPLYHRLLARLLRSESGPTPLPGVQEVFRTTDGRRDIIHGLLTGNYKPVARLKLSRTGLWHRFRFGAFGEASTARQDLVLLAAEEFRRRFRLPLLPPGPCEVYVIGDTPNDIAITKPYGLRCVAVATGHYPLEELRRHAPDHAIPDLTRFPWRILGLG